MYMQPLNPNVIFKNFLHIFFVLTQKATVTLLLQNGADATTCSPSGESALAFGTCQGQLDIVEQLLEYGADPNVCTLVNIYHRN